MIPLRIMLIGGLFVLSFFYSHPTVDSSLTIEEHVVGISTLGTENPSLLVRDVFIKGECANVNNIKAIGNLRGIGFFEGGTTSIGMASGIILATGPVNNSHGPNISESRTGDFRDNNEDPDLQGLATSTLYDNVGIEFEFVPQKEFVSFNYVFASEEYCEYVGSVFNDVFGFFVSGPGFSGPFDRNAENVALVPDSEEFVAINNINHLKNSDYYVKNELENDALQCRVAFAPQFPDLIEYDGFTTVLEAVFQVIPCETYRIRLVVGDVGDGNLDSAVFLEAKSFDIGPEVDIDFVASSSNSSNTMIESCVDGILTFRRTDNKKIEEDLIVNYNVKSSSTALEGVDFSNIPDTVIIPANVESVRFPIEAPEDNLDEGQESLTLEVDIPCTCDRGQRETFRIVDKTSLEIAPDTIVACLDGEIIFTPEITQGVGPFAYQWEDGSSESTLILDQVNNPQDFGLTVTDLCGDVLSTQFPIEVRPAASATYMGEFDWCPGIEFDIPVTLNGLPPWSLTYLLDDEQVIVDDIMDSPYTINIANGQNLVITSVVDANCDGRIEGGIVINNLQPTALPSITPLLCPGEADASILLNVESALPYQVRWDQRVNDNENPSLLASGTYNYTITDVNGCSFSSFVEIIEPGLEVAKINNCLSFKPEQNIFIPNAFSPDGDGNNDFFQIFAGSEAIGRVKSMRIFDRWGGVVFLADDFDVQDSSVRWDGRHRNQLLSNGVYLYQIELENIEGKVKMLSGSITLIR